MKRILGCAWLIALLCGCSETLEINEPMSLDKVPEGLVKTAQDKLPDVKFEVAYKIKFNGQDAYEIRGKAPDGKIREVELSATGEILEIE